MLPVTPVRLQSELRWTEAYKFSKYASEMTRVLKARVQSRLDHAAARITKTLLGLFNSPQHHVLVRGGAGALPEKLCKVMRTNSSKAGEFRKA